MLLVCQACYLFQYNSEVIHTCQYYCLISLPRLVIYNLYDIEKKYLDAMQHNHIVAMANLITIALILPLSYFLVRVWDLGVEGAVISLTASSICMLGLTTLLPKIHCLRLAEFQRFTAVSLKQVLRSQDLSEFLALSLLTLVYNYADLLIIE